MLLFTQTPRISASLVSAGKGGEGQQKVRGRGGGGGGGTWYEPAYFYHLLKFAFFYVFNEVWR